MSWYSKAIQIVNDFDHLGYSEFFTSFRTSKIVDINDINRLIADTRISVLISASVKVIIYLRLYFLISVLVNRPKLSKVIFLGLCALGQYLVQYWGLENWLLIFWHLPNCVFGSIPKTCDRYTPLMSLNFWYFFRDLIFELFRFFRLISGIGRTKFF